jgi:hypothetical protein
MTIYLQTRIRDNSLVSGCFSLCWDTECHCLGSDCVAHAIKEHEAWLREKYNLPDCARQY